MNTADDLYVPSPGGDPLDAIITFATEIGATTIAAFAVQWREELAAARFTIALVGTVELAERLPRNGVTLRYGVDACTDGRVDLVLADPSSAGAIRRGGLGREVLHVVDPARPGDLEHALDVVDFHLRRTGVTTLDDRAFEHRRAARRLLRHYVFEHQRALARTMHEQSARIRVLTIARSIAETAQVLRDRRGLDGRKQLASWLATERTKFLMSTKADALAALHDRLEREDPPSADAIAREVANTCMLPWVERMRVELDKPLAELTRQGLAELESALADLGEPLSGDVFAGAGLRPPRRRDLASSPPLLLGEWTARFGLVSRAKRRERADSVLISELEEGSRLCVARLRTEHEEARFGIERGLQELVDIAIEASQRASQLALRARRSSDGLAAARAQIESWFRALSMAHEP